jgi:DNA-binding CsgD family transcriptional regulator
MQKPPIDVNTFSAITQADEVKKICAPLIEQFDMNLFYFIQSYYHGPKKGKRILLSSSAEWVKDYFLTKHYEYELVNFPKLLQNKKFVASIWDGCNSNHDSCKIAMLSQTKYNLSHILYLTTQYDDYIEVFCFGIKKGHDHVPQQLLFNIDVFQQFCHYFMDAAHEIIQKAHKDAFVVPELPSKDYSNPHYIEAKFPPNKMSIERVFLKGKHQNVYLSLDEAKTIALACQSMQYRDIANRLAVSEPTIKYRMASIREKVGAKNKQALIRLFVEEGFVKDIQQALGKF